MIGLLLLLQSVFCPPFLLYSWRCLVEYCKSDGETAAAAAAAAAAASRSPTPKTFMTAVRRGEGGRRTILQRRRLL